MIGSSEPETGSRSRGPGLWALGVEVGDSPRPRLAKWFGFVVGGTLAVIQAVMDAVGPFGTIVVPAFTADNSDPELLGAHPQATCAAGVVAPDPGTSARV